MNDSGKPSRGLRKRKSLLVGLGGLAILAGMVFTRSPDWLFQSFGSKRTLAHGLLRVEPYSSPLYSIDGIGQVGDSEKDRVFLKTQLQLIKSQRVLERVATNPMIAQLPIIKRQKDYFAWLDRVIRVEPIKDTHLIRVSMEEGDPDDAYEIVKAVIISYMGESRIYGQSDNNVVVKTLKQESEKLKREIDESRRQIFELAKKTGLADPTRRGEYREHIRRELLRVKLQMAALKARGPRDEPRKGQGPANDDANPADSLKALEAQAKLLEAELSTAETNLAEAVTGERELLVLARRVEMLESFLSRVEGRLREAEYQAGSDSVRVMIADDVHKVGDN